MGKFFCRIGLHSWRLSNGIMYSQGKTYAIFYKKTCRRCGKCVDAVM